MATFVLIVIVKAMLPMMMMAMLVIMVMMTMLMMMIATLNHLLATALSIFPVWPKQTTFPNSLCVLLQ